MKKIKIGFLIDTMTVSSYDFDLIEHVRNNELFENPVFITGYKHPSIYRIEFSCIVTWGINHLTTLGNI